jgi:phage replication-related protein YjqB (UPF0714/DUF867 family)
MRFSPEELDRGMIEGPHRRASACYQTPLERRTFLRLLGTAAPMIAHGCLIDGSFDDERRPTDPRFGFGIAVEELIAHVDVHKAASSQSIVSKPETCSLAEQLGAWIEVGDQVRIRRNDGAYALYTVADLRSERSPQCVRMGLKGRERLDTSATFSATLSAKVTATGLTDAEAEALSEFVERLVDDGSNAGLVVAAPHGGDIEFNTDRQAERVLAQLGGSDVSSWICKGWRQGGGAHERWHITSTAISPRSFSGLQAIAEREFAYAVAFHGMSDDGIWIGGGAPESLKRLVRDAIVAALDGADIEVRIVDPGDPLAGSSPNNLVNWLTAAGTGGVQIEQSKSARQHHWTAIADAVAEVYSGLL